MKFSKKKTVIIISSAVISLIIAVVIFLYHKGFRITYAPKLETSWDAVSGFAAWVGILVSILAVAVSGLAIYYAVQVPEKIADRQDKISLFDKRLDCYCELQKLIFCGKMLENCNEELDAFDIISSLFGNPNVDKFSDAKNEIISRLNSVQLVLISGKFIFPVYDWEKAVELCVTAGRLTESIMPPSIVPVRSENFSSLKNEFCEKCNEFDKRFKIAMDSELNLK